MSRAIVITIDRLAALTGLAETVEDVTDEERAAVEWATREVYNDSRERRLAQMRVEGKG